MTTSLPRVLTSRDLPLPELQAALLDGEVFRLDEAFCSIAEFDGPCRRAEALAGALGRTFVAAGSSAAWVWGAVARPPAVHEAFVAVDVGRRLAPQGVLARDVSYEPGDVVDFGPVVVTAPVRTVVDLVRLSGPADSAVDVALRLVLDHRLSRQSCDEVLGRSRNLPYRRQAAVRLDGVFAAAAAATVARAAAASTPSRLDPG